MQGIRDRNQIAVTPTTYRFAALLFGVGWIALTSPWLIGGLTIPYDAKAHFYAQLQFLSTALHSGQSPFWNTNVFAGSPQIADPQSLIFSPALLLAYFDREPSFGILDAYAFGLLALGSLGIIGLFRDRQWHPVGALIAAYAFSFGASASWRIQHIGEIQSYALFGLALWLLSRALHRKTLGSSLAAGMTCGLMIAEPDQVALLASYTLAIFGLTEIAFAGFRGESLRQYVKTAFVIGASGLLVAGVPLLLTYLFVERSSRPHIEFAEAIRGSLHPASLLTAWIGDLYGALDSNVTYWGPYSVSWDKNELTLSQNMSQLYFGALPILLLCWLGLFRQAMWSREVRALSAALLVMLLYAVGRFTPFFWAFYKVVPGVDLFRRPADATFLIGALAAVLGGYAAHRLMTDKHVPFVDRHARAHAAFVALLIVAGFAIAEIEKHPFDALKPLAMASACLLVSAASILLLRGIGRFRVEASLVGVAALMCTDLHLNNGPNDSTALPTANYEFMRRNSQNETVRFLKTNLQRAPGSARRDRVEMVGMGFSWPNIGMIHGFDHVLGYNPLRLDTTARALAAGETIAGWNQRRFSPLFPSYRSLLADMLGLRYIVSPIPIGQIDSRLREGDLRLVARTRDGFIYENPRAFPRAMFVQNWMQVDFETLMKTGQWPEFDPATTVLLERPPRQQPNKSAIERVSTATAQPAEILHFENTKITVEVNAATDGFLLLNSVWHPWWRASVDDEPADILKANVLFRAVQVSAGRHVVKFEFEPLVGALAELSSQVPQ